MSLKNNKPSFGPFGCSKLVQSTSLHKLSLVLLPLICVSMCHVCFSRHHPSVAFVYNHGVRKMRKTNRSYLLDNFHVLQVQCEQPLRRTETILDHNVWNQGFAQCVCKCGHAGQFAMCAFRGLCRPIFASMCACVHVLVRVHARVRVHACVHARRCCFGNLRHHKPVTLQLSKHLYA